MTEIQAHFPSESFNVVSEPGDLYLEVVCPAQWPGSTWLCSRKVAESQRPFPGHSYASVSLFSLFLSLYLSLFSIMGVCHSSSVPGLQDWCEEPYLL